MSEIWFDGSLISINEEGGAVEAHPTYCSATTRFRGGAPANDASPSLKKDKEKYESPKEEGNNLPVFKQFSKNHSNPRNHRNKLRSPV